MSFRQPDMLQAAAPRLPQAFGHRFSEESVPTSSVTWLIPKGPRHCYGAYFPKS